MKLVVAVVRPEKLNDVLEALFHTDVKGLTIHRVQGHGGETEQVQTYRGTTVKMELSEKVRIEVRGVRSSWLTVATNSRFICSSRCRTSSARRRSVTSSCTQIV